MKTTLRRFLEGGALALGFLALLAGLSGTSMAYIETPEIDAGSIVNSLLVASGGLALIAGRRRRAK